MIMLWKKKNRKTFKWTYEVIENWSDCILNYKFKCDFSNIYFDADKPVL